MGIIHCLFIVGIIIFTFLSMYKFSRGGALSQRSTDDSDSQCGAISCLHILCGDKYRDIAYTNLFNLYSSGEMWAETVMELLLNKCNQIRHTRIDYALSDLLIEGRSVGTLCKRFNYDGLRYYDGFDYYIFSKEML